MGNNKNNIFSRLGVKKQKLKDTNKSRKNVVRWVWCRQLILPWSAWARTREARSVFIFARNGCYHYHFNDNSLQGGLIIFHWHAMAVNIIIITPREAWSSTQRLQLGSSLATRTQPWWHLKICICCHSPPPPLPSSPPPSSSPRRPSSPQPQQVEANSYIVAKHGVIALTRSLGVKLLNSILIDQL